MEKDATLQERYRETYKELKEAKIRKEAETRRKEEPSTMSNGTSNKV